MSDVHARLRAHLRLAILRFLTKEAAFRANSSWLKDLCTDQAGFSVTRDQVRTELAWLAEQGLVTTSEAIEGLVVATLTERGGDVASGAAVAPGVLKPGP